METITYVRPLKDRKIEVIFSDEYCAEIDMRPFIKSNDLSQPLNDEAFFQTVTVDETGGIIWSNGFDCCPVFIRQIADSK